MVSEILRKDESELPGLHDNQKDQFWLHRSECMFCSRLDQFNIDYEIEVNHEYPFLQFPKLNVLYYSNIVLILTGKLDRFQ